MAITPGKLVLPGTVPYENGSCFDRYRWACDWLEDVEAGGGDEDDRLDAEGEIRFQAFICAGESPDWDLHHNIHVRDSDGAIRPLESRSGQARLFRMIDNAERMERPCRIAVKKARKEGISTGVGCRFYLDSSRLPGCNTLVMAHDDPSSKEIFRTIYLTAWKNDPIHPETSENTKGSLVFTDLDSSIQVRTAAGLEGLSRGYTLRRAHISEPAEYEPEKGAAVFTSVMNAMVPPPAFTVAIMESTSRGSSGIFPEICIQAWRDPKSTDWQVMFIPWFDLTLCRLPFSDHRECFRFENDLTDEEREMKRRHDLDLEQLNWRRWIERNSIHGKTHAERRRRMRQEYPTEFMDGFEEAENCAFDVDLVNSLLRHPRVCPPKWVGDLKIDSQLWDPRETRFRFETPNPRFTMRENGPLMIWERPRGDRRYDIGADPARGGDNPTALYVTDRDLMDTVAIWLARCPPTEISTAIRLLSKWYGDAMINPEVTGAEHLVEELSETDRVQFLYQDRRKRSDVDHKIKAQYGTTATQSSNAAIVAALDSAMRRHPNFFRSRILLEQMLTYQQVETSGATGPKRMRYIGARGRDEDDVVDGAGLSLRCIQDMPHHRNAPRREHAGRRNLIAERELDHSRWVKARHATGDDLELYDGAMG